MGKTLGTLVIILVVIVVLLAAISAAGIQPQSGGTTIPTPVADPNCPTLINNGEKFQHYNLQPCHGLQIIDITAQQSGDIQNDSGRDVKIRWNGEIRDLPQNLVSTFLGPGRLEAPVE